MRVCSMRAAIEPCHWSSWMQRGARVLFYMCGALLAQRLLRQLRLLIVGLRQLLTGHCLGSFVLQLLHLIHWVAETLLLAVLG